MQANEDEELEEAANEDCLGFRNISFVLILVVSDHFVDDLDSFGDLWPTFWKLILLPE